VFTSLYPTRHGVTTGFLAHQRHAAMAEESGRKIVLNRLPASMETLPELMRGAGYATFGLATNINIGDEIGFDRGFDRFDRSNGRSAGKVARQLAAWQKKIQRPGRPYFLYLHFNDVHAPYKPRDPWYEDTGKELARTVSAYDSEISYLDRLLEGLYRDFGWQRNTLLMVVSDHGEELGEHGRMGHEFSLFEELMRVLMVVSGEDLDIPARTVDVPASLVDVLPTILDLAGAPPPNDRDGRSLAPFLGPDPPAADSALARRTLYAHRLKPAGPADPEALHMWAAVDGTWKLIDAPGDRQLFQIEVDPRERRDRSERRPGIAARLERQLDQFRAGGFAGAGDTAEVELDDKTLEELKTLGYVQ
jgi:arylsulfatase A-like enzyme